MDDDYFDLIWKDMSTEQAVYYLWNTTADQPLMLSDISPENTHDVPCSYFSQQSAMEAAEKYTNEYKAYGIKFEIIVIDDLSKFNADRARKMLLGDFNWTRMPI